MNYKYSVLMSVYYKENPDYFRASIKSMLNQTIKPYEIIIVKDGKLTRELDEVLSEFKENKLIKVIALEENKGLGEALNIGLQYCSSEIIARMDTDDISREDRCEKQLKLFNENKHLSIISSSVAEFDDDPSKVNSIKKLPTKHDDILKYAKKRNPFNHPAVMFKKSAVQSAGGYQDFPFFEDYYLWIRMIKQGCICENIDDTLVFMRANSNLYRRRGGLLYFKYILKFNITLKKEGFYTLFDLVLATITRGTVALLPNGIRKFIYKSFLRKKHK